MVDTVVPQPPSLEVLRQLEIARVADIEAAAVANHTRTLAVEAARQAGNIELEAERNTNAVTQETKRAKLEAVRMAKEMLTENRRNLPVGEREVSATDITTFAATLNSYINS